jgi:hypothetical protein
MEKPTRHLLTGANLGKSPILRGIQIDGESLFLRAQYRHSACGQCGGLIHSHFGVFNPMLS